MPNFLCKNPIALAVRVSNNRNFYKCTNQILRGLGRMCSDGGDFTKNIDKCGGLGTAAFVDEAIQIYCDNAE